MTLGECLQRCDALRPNTASEAEKARWVLETEEELASAFFPLYRDPAPEGARRWPEDRAKVLSASGPFEELYLFRVLARLELMDQEWESYNFHTALANQLESEFKKGWARTHRRRERGAAAL